MTRINDPDEELTSRDKIRRAVKKLKVMPFEGRLQLLVRAKLMTEAEAAEVLERRKAKEAEAIQGG